MPKKTKRLKAFAGICIIMFCLYGCGPTISQFDQYAYTQTTSLKVDVLNVMDKAVDSYTSHIADIDQVNTELMKNIEYEKHRAKNQITIDMYNIMWKLLNDNTSTTIGRDTFQHGFFPRWRNKNKLDTTFIGQAKIQVGEGFDMIAELESKKIKPSESKVQSFLSRNQ